MKMKRVLGILLAVMMVAVCGCAKDEPKKPVVEDEPKYTVRDGFVTDLEDVIKLKYTNNETTIVVVMSDGAWFKDGDTETWMNQSILMSIVKTASQMSYLEEIKDFKSLADYGLEKPAYTITMENEDGFIVNLYIGNVEGETECYVAADDKKVVYKVSNAIIGMLEFDEEKLLAVEVDPMQYLKDMEEEIEGDDGLGNLNDIPVEDTVTEPSETPEEPEIPTDPEGEGDGSGAETGEE